MRAIRWRAFRLVTRRMSRSNTTASGEVSYTCGNASLGRHMYSLSCFVEGVHFVFQRGSHALLCRTCLSRQRAGEDAGGVHHMSVVPQFTMAFSQPIARIRGTEAPAFRGLQAHVSLSHKAHRNVFPLLKPKQLQSERLGGLSMTAGDRA